MILVRDILKCHLLWQPYVFTLQRYRILDVQRVLQCEHQTNHSDLDCNGMYCCHCWSDCNLVAFTGDIMW